MHGRCYCPECNRLLPPAGEMRIEDDWYIIYQCMECLEYFELDGDIYETPLTFAVDPCGSVIRVDDRCV